MATSSRTAATLKPAPPLRRVGEPQGFSTTPEYGNRPGLRGTYRVPTVEELRGTVLEGKTASEVDRFYDDQARKRVRDQGRKRQVTFRAMADGTYRVDVLEALPPTPNVVRFADLFPMHRDGIADSLNLVLGVSDGTPLISDADTWPHAIIGGSAGGGKTVFVGSLMAQLADKSPAIVRLALGDMAAVGLAPFRHLPHMMAPLATSVEELRSLVETVKTEMDLRQTFFRSTFEIHRADGSKPVIDGFSDVRHWNRFAQGIGRPDLALPMIVLAIDEWKVAMDRSKEADQLLAVTSAVMRRDRKWGARVWLMAQSPKKGGPGDETFPSDIMENATTRVALARGAGQVFWGIVLGRTWSEDKERLVAANGEIPVGRGMLAFGSSTFPFQGMFINEEPDEFETFTSELQRLVSKQVKRWKDQDIPGARLLGERPYAMSKYGRVVIDPSEPGDAAVGIVEGVLLSATTTVVSSLSFGGSDGRAAGWVRDLPLEDDSEGALPRSVIEWEVKSLDALTAARVIYAWQNEVDSEYWQDDQARGVSITRASFLDRLAGLGLPTLGASKVSAALAHLRVLGLLVEVEDHPLPNPPSRLNRALTWPDAFTRIADAGADASE